MKKIKYIIMICLITLVSTGCVKYDASMDIKRDKSMNFSIIYAMDSSLGLDKDSLSKEEKEELDKNGFKVSEYKDDKYIGNKITKKYLTPHQKCTILRVRRPCTPLMVIYNHNAHPARFFFCLDIISIFKGWPR
jgi:hypothetical protein